MTMRGRAAARGARQPPAPAGRLAAPAVDPALESLHAAAGNRAVAALLDPAVAAELARPGEPLDPASRTLMERRFGEDLGGVRVHADSRAASSARAAGALAYTVGEHVVLRDGPRAGGCCSRTSWPT